MAGECVAVCPDGVPMENGVCGECAKYLDKAGNMCVDECEFGADGGRICRTEPCPNYFYLEGDVTVCTDECPKGAFHEASGKCVAACPDGADSDGLCRDTEPDSRSNRSRLIVVVVVPTVVVLAAAAVAVVLICRKRKRAGASSTELLEVKTTENMAYVEGGNLRR